MNNVIGCTTRPLHKLSFAAACKHIADAGYTDVAVFANEGKAPVRSDSTGEEIAATRQAAEDAGLKPSMLLGRTQLNLGLDAAVEDYCKLIDNAAELGAVWLLDCGTSKEEHFDDYFELMRQAAVHAGRKGVVITLKPHGGISLTSKDILKAKERVNQEAFGICYDPGNIIHYSKGEERPEDSVEEVAPAVYTAIIKDCVVVDGKPNVQITPGEGLVDFEKVIGALVKSGFSGPFYVECVRGDKTEEIIKNIRATHQFVSDILAGL
ncbi:MAG: sugar phosphate isomerase/epimerase [Planctomycetota bacterium]|nr:sugar phosphate isomerase/epimerase [Planctomycetota bacterium]MDA1137580.1 sugar phosphate isomerase/epimerase [Planctomycetota bacterium]